MVIVILSYKKLAINSSAHLDMANAALVRIFATNFYDANALVCLEATLS